MDIPSNKVTDAGVDIAARMSSVVKKTEAPGWIHHLRSGPLGVKNCLGTRAQETRQVKKQVIGRAGMHVSNNAVTGKHFAQNPPSLTVGGQFQQLNAGMIAQSGIRLLLVKEGAVESVGIKAQCDFADVKALRIGVAPVHVDQK